MQAWLCDNPIGEDALRWQTLPTPQPGPKQVRIRITAASVNYPDLLIVNNQYQIKPELPFVPGAEFSGVIEALGSEVAGLQVGQRVACLNGSGGFASHAVVDAALCMPLPPGFDPIDAAAFIMTYATSYHALLDRGALQPGETVLVLGAAGGVGTAAIQIAKAHGARVIAAASSDDKCQLCLKAGADLTLNYSAHPPGGDWREQIKRLTDGKGPDVVYDPIGGEWAEPTFRSIAWRGRYLVIGFVGGPIPNIALNLPLLKGASIVGVFWGAFARSEPKTNAKMMQNLAQWYLQGRIKPLIDQTLPMSALHQAYARMRARQVQGKLVLVND